MSKQASKDLKITNITYVHDPYAMKRWIDLYVEIFKDVLLKEFENTNSDEQNL